MPVLSVPREAWESPQHVAVRGGNRGLFMSRSGAPAHSWLFRTPALSNTFLPFGRMFPEQPAPSGNQLSCFPL